MLSITRNKEKKHDKILMLAKSELSSVENASVHLLVEKETGIMWVSMKNVQGVQNISDLVLKDIYGIHKRKNPDERVSN